MALSQKGFLEITAGALGAIAVASVVLYPWALRGLPSEAVKYTPTTTDAIWFTLQTITTTGYGSLPPGVWESSDKLKWLSIFLMLSAVPLWTASVTVLFDLIAQRQR